MLTELKRLINRHKNNKPSTTESITKPSPLTTPPEQFAKAQQTAEDITLALKLYNELNESPKPLK